MGSHHHFETQFNSLSHEVSCTIILHPNLGKKMGEKFQKYVQDNFDWNKLALQLENTLND